MDLEKFNTAPADELLPALLACCDVPAWAHAVLADRPYHDRAALDAVADRAASEFSRVDVARAMAAHPRIGERAAGQATEAAWSRGEQSGVARDAETQQALLEGNRAYEERFGRIFLICANGRSGEEILAALRQRLAHDDDTEAAVIADELRKIALVRLGKVIDR